MECANYVPTHNTISLLPTCVGDMLRAAIQAGTPMGVKAKSVMDAGKVCGCNQKKVQHRFFLKKGRLRILLVYKNIAASMHLYIYTWPALTMYIHIHIHIYNHHYFFVLTYNMHTYIIMVSVLVLKTRICFFFSSCGIACR